MRLGIWKLIATAGGAGYLPKAPGTFGAVVGILLLGLCNYWVAVGWVSTGFFPESQFIFWIILTTVVGAKSAHILSSEAGWEKDDQRIVIDEVVGVWIAMLFVPVYMYSLFVGFVLFRFYDIKKPFGIRWMERFGRGWGVMLDDVLAGVYACLTIHVIRYLVTFA